MIITIAHEKGGMQTPVFAQNLAVLRAMDGHRGLLADTHPHKYSLTWA
jgi:hypothetical protein